MVGQTDRQTGRQTDRQTDGCSCAKKGAVAPAGFVGMDRQTDRQKGRQADRQTDAHMHL
jgi:hypothetical protein